MEVIIIDHKTERITFRISPDELKKIEAKANKSNMKVSEYVRDASLDKNIIVIDDLKSFTKELRGIGTNLNQLTILCYQGRITCLDISTTKKKVNEIWQLLNSLMVKTKRNQG